MASTENPYRVTNRIGLGLLGVFIALLSCMVWQNHTRAVISINDRAGLHGELDKLKSRLDTLESVSPRMFAAAHPSETFTATPRFSPGDPKPETGIVALIAAAQTSIRVQAYSFTSRPIAEALIAAKARGVDVRVILDARMAGERGGMAQTLADGGVVVLLDSAEAIAHNKVILVDAKSLVTGSYNFTAAAAERNAENALFLESPEIAGAYLANWERHAGHAKGVGK